MTGKGTGLIDAEKPVYIADVLPDEEIQYHVIHESSHYALGICDALLHQSAVRCVPPCPLSGQCGGCQLQHMSYDAQVTWKLTQIQTAFPNIPIKVFAESPFSWRNKVQLDSFHGVLGLSKRHSNIPISISNCPLVLDGINQILKFLHPCPLQKGRVIIREHDQQHLLAIASSDKNWQLVHKKWLEVLEKIPSVTSFYIGSMDDFTLYKGDPYIYQTVGKLRFPIGPNSFFQANTLLLHDFVSAIASEVGYWRVWDLYAGSGLLGLSVAQKAKAVILAESNHEARLLGKTVIQKYGLTNANYRDATAEDTVEDVDLDDIVILDPPRAGCSQTVLRTLCVKTPRKIIYVACALQPLIVAAKQFGQVGYIPKKNYFFDMFPNTIHAEVIVIFERHP